MNSNISFSLITNEVRLVNNNLPKGEFKMDLKLNQIIQKDDEVHSRVTYVLEIKNTPETPFPIDLLVSVTGLFDITNINEKDVDDFLKVQSCQIIFPYIRSMITSLTSNAFLPPLILPIVDARKLFGKKD